MYRNENDYYMHCPLVLLGISSNQMETIISHVTPLFRLEDSSIVNIPNEYDDISCTHLSIITSFV